MKKRLAVFSMLLVMLVLLAACSNANRSSDNSTKENTTNGHSINKETQAKKTPATKCPNGILETGEECDDGNLKEGDGCSPTCKKEKKCEDSDGGLEINKKGVTFGFFKEDNSFKSKEDYCENTLNVFEYRCVTDYQAEGASYGCRKGCFKGECLP